MVLATSTCNDFCVEDMSVMLLLVKLHFWIMVILFYSCIFHPHGSKTYEQDEVQSICGKPTGNLLSSDIS